MGRLRRRARGPLGERNHHPQAAHLATAMNLANEAATRELAAALRDRNLRGIVLKGPALGRWLYDDMADRVSQDIDVLVSWDDLDAVEDVLRTIGWRYLGIDRVGKDRPHCRIWERPDNGLILELHRTLAGIGVAPSRTWEVLSAHTEELSGSGLPIEVLDVPARALHVALHATQHGTGMARTQEDLRLALQRVSPALWREAGALAAELQATAAFTTGLGLVPEGRALLSSLRLHVERSPEAELRAGTAPPMANGLEWMSRQEGWWAKASFLARHLVPPPGYMRVWFRPARRGRLGLALAYVWRPAWLLLRAAPAVREWRRARRGAR